MLPTMNGPYFFAIDCMHLLEIGCAKMLFELLTVSLQRPNNSCINYMYHQNEPEHISNEAFPFWIDQKKLVKAGNLVQKSKPFVSSSFGSKWVNPIEYGAGHRAADYKNWLLYVLPTTFAPLIESKEAQAAVLKLVKACALCFQWCISEDELEDIKR